MNSFVKLKLNTPLAISAIDNWIYSHLVIQRKMVTVTYQELPMLQMLYVYRLDFLTHFIKVVGVIPTSWVRR